MGINDNSNTMTEAERNMAAAETGSQKIWKFCITGGPCGGKTTALARVYSFLKDRGFEVCTAPEAYGILASNGMSMDFYASKFLC
jgi:predicted ATPase